MPARRKYIIVVEDEQDLEAGASVYLTKPVGYLDMEVAVGKVPSA